MEKLFEKGNNTKVIVINNNKNENTQTLFKEGANDVNIHWKIPII